MASGVVGGTEELWNVKELVRRIGSLVGSEHPVKKEISWLKARVGKFSDHLSERIGDDLGSWLEQYHGAHFIVSRERDATLISLTDEGVEKFATEVRPCSENVECGDKDLASELRNNVFEELRQESMRRRAEGTLYSSEKK